MQLRNFLFLDTSALGDYLATLQGSVIDGPIDQTETGTKEKGGRFGTNVSFAGIETNLSSGNSIETR